ncbi:MAG: flagellar basal body protein [Clostridium sp.]
MMRSLYSGVSGLKVHQTKMDVIGNNISNVNTVGFRGSTVNFTDVFYQTTQNASGPNATTGTAGTNAVQIGLGSNVAAISVDLSGTGATPGSTDRVSMDHAMINGDAFLIVLKQWKYIFHKTRALVY